MDSICLIRDVSLILMFLAGINGGAFSLILLYIEEEKNIISKDPMLLTQVLEFYPFKS